MFAFMKAKRRRMRGLSGSNDWSWRSPAKVLVRRRTLDDYTARECEVIAQRWDVLAHQATTDQERALRERLAREWRGTV